MNILKQHLFWLLLPGTLLLAACPGKLAPSVGYFDSPSTSEIAEAVMSGFVNASSPTGTMAQHNPLGKKQTSLAQMIKSSLTLVPNAQAAVAGAICVQPQNPVFIPAQNNSCGATTNALGQQILSLAWGPCNLNAPYATWSGGENFTILSSPGNTSFTATSACSQAAFPGFQNGDVVAIWYNSPTSRIYNIINPPLNPVTVLIDTYVGTLIYGATNTPQSNWPSYAYTGYLRSQPSKGALVSYTGAVARTISIPGIHLAGEINGYLVWDFTVSTTNPSNGTSDFPIAVNAAGNVTGGTIFVQNNRKLVTTQSLVAGTINYGGGINCGVPVGGAGTLTTTAIDGSFTTETLAGWSATCGQATLNGSAKTLIYSF